MSEEETTATTQAELLEQPKASSENLLVSLDDYLSNGVHVGLKYRTSDMRPFIYKIRSDKLCVFDVQKIDERLRLASQFIARFRPEEILVVSNRVYGRQPAKKFATYTGAKTVPERFVSGTLTNPNIRSYVEPKLLIVTDPTADQQAIKEAAASGITVLAICDTNTRLKNIDFVIPSNNKGKNSLALIYKILTREVLKQWGKEGFDAPLEEFISTAEPQPYLLEALERKRRQRRKRGFSRR
ncbi:30S ribosomal protein S2 [uncultured archaeon]|nr:30S ribosomal protein S2 [uncultured archaeon]